MKIVKINPSVVLRIETDDWALLYDPDSGKAFGINPVSVFICQRLDGKHTLNEILSELLIECDSVPPDALNQISHFTDELIEHGLAEKEFVNLNNS